MGVDRHCATRPGAVLARLVSDYGDPLRPRYEHVDYESTCIDCGKIGGSPQPCPMWGLRVGFTPEDHGDLSWALRVC